jgi:DNA-binding MarR family transcriptional regulator
MTKDELMHHAEEAEEFAHRLLAFAGNLRSQSSDTAEPRLFWPEGQSSLSKTVASILTLRKGRAKHFDASLFGEPGWDMLLTLFEAYISATELTVEAVCRSGGSYPSTSRRWLAILVDRGLVEVNHDELDDPLKSVRLTEKGVLAMTKSLFDLQEAR